MEHLSGSVKERSMRSHDARNFNAEYNSYQSEERQLKLEQTAAVKKCVLNHKQAIEFVFVLRYIQRFYLPNITILFFLRRKKCIDT